MSQLRTPWREALVPWAVSRTAVLLATLTAAILLPARPHWPWYLSATEPRNPFAVWDAVWYREIALIGYPSGQGVTERFAFFPLYPLVVRALQALGLHVWDAALLVSNASFYLALVALCALVQRRHGAATARRALLYLAAFPFSFYFSHGYAESLFLLLTVAAFLFAEQRRWVAGGVAGAAAALTRPYGALMVIPAAVWLMRAAIGRAEGAGLDDRAPGPEPDGLERRGAQPEHLEPRGPETSVATSYARPLAGPALVAAGPLLGVAAYSLFCLQRTGDALAWLHAHEAWGYELGASPWAGYATFLEQVRTFGLYASLTSYPYSIYGFLGALLAALFVVLAVALVPRMGAAYVAWSLAMLLVPLGSGSWEALGRYCALNFPVFVALSTIENRTLETTATVGAAVLLGLLAALFVSGHPFT